MTSNNQSQPINTTQNNQIPTPLKELNLEDRHSESIKPQLISHELTNIGRLDITLHGISAQLYRKLDEDGLIDHLKNLDHLGFISKSHPGNHHKKWDYVCLQLYFLQRLKHETFKTGLNRNTVIEGKNASNQEILQTFILFSSVGHLEGTLASEKGLFDFLLENPEKKQQFLANIIKYPELTILVNKIFNEYDIYKVKYLIALNYIIRARVDSRILKSIRLILGKYLSENDSKFEKLKILYSKIRKVSFVYLDSFHCQMPLQVNLSKILLNPFAYDTLFNPVDHDYDSILDACETALSKELYISPKSSLVFCKSSENFQKYLNKHKTGVKPINYSNFLISILNGRLEKYITQFIPESSYHSFQFYLAKDALKFFDVPINANFTESIIALHKKEGQLTATLNRNLPSKQHSVTVQHDVRKTLLFFSFLIERKSLNQSTIPGLLKSLNLTFNEILHSVDFSKVQSLISDNAAFISRKNLQKDIIRRYFLYIFKLLFQKENRLNLFIKFEYRQLITALNNSSPLDRVYETSFVRDRSELMNELSSCLNKNLPKDIINNIKIMKHLLETRFRPEENLHFFYSIFPIEIEEMIYSAKELDSAGNSETRTTITDIDAVLIAFNDDKYELYIIEGKKARKKFIPECKESLQKIRSISNHPEVFSEPEIIQNNAKGGIISITSK